MTTRQNNPPRPKDRSLPKALSSLLFSAILLLCSCGDPTLYTPKPPPDPFPSENSLTILEDQYGLQSPNYVDSYLLTDTWVGNAAIRRSANDLWYGTVLSLDIEKVDGSFPSIAGQTYVIEESGDKQRLPGSLCFFNGRLSTYKKVESGVITFTPDSAVNKEVKGEFDVVMTDKDSVLVPAPRYRITGKFDFVTGTEWFIASPSVATYPVAGEQIFIDKCSRCHILMSNFQGQGFLPNRAASNLAGRGAELNRVYSAEPTYHSETPLRPDEYRPLGIYLNSFYRPWR